MKPQIAQTALAAGAAATAAVLATSSAKVDEGLNILMALLQYTEVNLFTSTFILYDCGASSTLLLTTLMNSLLFLSYFDIC